MTHNFTLFHIVIEVYPIETPRAQKKSAELVPRAVLVSFIIQPHK